MMKRWQGRWANNKRRYANLECVKVILPWSTPAMRFCTSELKSAVIASALVKRFPGQAIVSACGVRRDESRSRSCAETSKTNKRLTNKARKTTGVDWNPIAHWLEADVYAFLAAEAFPLHEGYVRFGMTRISCIYCIMQSIDDQRAAASRSTSRSCRRSRSRASAGSATSRRTSWTRRPEAGSSTPRRARTGAR